MICLDVGDREVCLQLWILLYFFWWLTYNDSLLLNIWGGVSDSYLGAGQHVRICVARALHYESFPLFCFEIAVNNVSRIGGILCSWHFERMLDTERMIK